MVLDISKIIYGCFGYLMQMDLNGTVMCFRLATLMILSTFLRWLSCSWLGGTRYGIREC